MDQRKYESPKFDEINTKIYIYINIVGSRSWFSAHAYGFASKLVSYLAG